MSCSTSNERNCHSVLSVLSENISNPIYVKCDKMYQPKVCVQEFWYFVPGLDIQHEQPENDNPACNKAVAGCASNIKWFSLRTYSSILVVKASCSEFSDMESIRAGCWTSLQPSPFCMVALSPSVRHWHAASSFKFIFKPELLLRLSL